METRYPMSEDTYQVNKGGLMRCCLLTLDEVMQARKEIDIPSSDGQRIVCKYCTAGVMIREDGVWKWDHD